MTSSRLGTALLAGSLIACGGNGESMEGTGGGNVDTCATPIDIPSVATTRAQGILDQVERVIHNGVMMEGSLPTRPIFVFKNPDTQLNEAAQCLDSSDGYEDPHASLPQSITCTFVPDLDNYPTKYLLSYVETDTTDPNETSFYAFEGEEVPEGLSYTGNVITDSTSPRACNYVEGFELYDAEGESVLETKTLDTQTICPTEQCGTFITGFNANMLAILHEATAEKMMKKPKVIGVTQMPFHDIRTSQERK